MTISGYPPPVKQWRFKDPKLIKVHYSNVKKPPSLTIVISPNVSCKVLDGAVIVQILSPRTTNAFHADKIFYPYIDNVLFSCSELILCGRNIYYIVLKTYRVRRGVGIRWQA